MDGPEAANGPATDWERLRPVVDDVLHALGEADRVAILLRFFEGRPFAEIGARLAVSEDAARMRVERALEKMRGLLARRGLTSTAAALGAVLAPQTQAAVPAGLAAQIAGGAGVAAATMTFMTISKLQVGLALALAAAGTTGLVWQYRTNARLEAEKVDLQAQLAAVRTHQATARPAPVAAGAGLREPAGDGRPHAEDAASVRAPQSLRPAVGANLGTGGLPLAARLTPVETLGNVGRASPRAAFATQLWAARTGNSDLEATTLTFGPEARAKLVALAAELPANLSSECDTPEKLMAFILTGSPHPVGGMQVLGETPQGDDDVTLQAEWQHTDDTIVHHSDVQMHREADGWKWVVPVILVDRAAAYLTRNSGN